MNTYKITLSETRYIGHIVEATNEDEAMDKLEAKYKNGELKEYFELARDVEYNFEGVEQVELPF